jgi:hypothetical protein
MKSALTELEKIIKMKDEKAFKYSENREKALKVWIFDWISQVEASQLVVNPKYISSEFDDVLKEQLTKNVLEQVTEEAVEFTKSANKISSKLIVIRKKPKE